ncbi:MAG: methyl-accepting chemotaxis protein [Bacteroidetes bacterium]|nr:methyl-accepting chemotaxis protein [Bacteroidota bacterium]
MKWFKSLKVMTKLLLSVAIMCSFMTLLGYVGIRDMSTINGMLNSLYNNDTVGISHIKQANVNLVAHQRAIRNLLLATSNEERSQSLRDMKTYESNMLAEMEEATPTVKSENGKQLLSRFWPAWQDYKKVADSIASLATSMRASSQNRQAIDLSNTLGQETADAVDTIISEMAREYESNGQNAYYRSDAIYRSSSSELLWFVIGAVVMGIIYGIFISRILSRPILMLDEAAGKVAGGDINVSVEADSKDELGNLAASFNRMVLNIRTAMQEIREKGAAAETAAREAGEAKSLSEKQSQYLASSVESILSKMNKFAEGDLTVSLDVDGDDDIAKLFSGFNKSVNNIHAMIRQLQESIETTASAATQISSSSEQLAAGVQEQSAQANEVAAAVEEMTRTIIENSKNATQTAQAAMENGKMAKDGGDVVRETTNKMREIADVVRDSAGTVHKLGESSKEISEIISVIDDIADQTNLLALNAAIEAARAGDQGKGFAVVADEVRKLAERTTQATKQIEDMIRSIQSETREAVDSMKKGTEEVEEGMLLANKAGEALEKMVAEAQKSVDMINQIAAASEEQSTTSEQISRNVESISSVSSESAAGVSQIARSSDDLNRLTENLRNLVSKFTVDNSRRFGEAVQGAAGGNGHQHVPGKLELERSKRVHST